MPPSQLKRLKASLREQGIVGPQKSKKQKKEIAQNGLGNDKRVQRTAALNGIREQFNPFEIKTSARGPKFEVTTNRSLGGKVTKSVKGRPGVTKGLGEENRRKTLLIEMQRRNKVGGIMDRRFGENDPKMAPEEKMAERFAQEIQRRHKNSSVFDLEDDDDHADLTHMGQSLSLDGPNLEDDFDEEGLQLSDEEDYALAEEHRLLKRRFSTQSENSEDENAEGQPERKKTKQEVMKEVIAKSKLYKYERQAAKDEDRDEIEEIDKELPEIQALLRGLPPRPAAPKLVEVPGMNADRQALLNRTDKEKFDKEFDMRQRKMAQDKKSKPTERTKTEEEKLAEESRRLQELEARRLRRMQGDMEEENDINGNDQNGENFDQSGEEEDFGLGTGIKTQNHIEELGVEDEDDFVIDDDLVASESEVETSDDDELARSVEDTGEADDEEFVEKLLSTPETKRPGFLTGANAPLPEPELPKSNGINGNLAYVFECPQSHEELLKIMKDVEIQDLPLVVRRIRSLYHPQLRNENKAKLGNFTVALIDHIFYLANQSPSPPSNTLETLIRHIHSLSNMYTVESANAFRLHLEELHQSRALSPTSGDLILLTAIASIFPTSDHFHQVVTPAMLCISRYVGQKIPHTLTEYAIGTYMATLCLHYQRLSKRYVPEVIGFLLNSLYALSPTRPQIAHGSFHRHESKQSLRLENAGATLVRRLTLLDTAPAERSSEEETSLKAALLESSMKLLDVAADTWSSKPSFSEIFFPALDILKHLSNKNCRPHLPRSIQTKLSKIITKLTVLIAQSRHSRRPLLLHNHKPLAIKTSIPKFEESFNPSKHYDPDRERAESSKLRAEHKKERKGAMRELRKDANFIARESLREKKARDEQYEKKYKRLVAEIQGEEGREKKAYEREREFRRKGRK